MQNKKILALALAAFATLGLTSCGKKIYPGLKPDSITIQNGEGVFSKDDLTYIYEKLHDSSSTPSEVRDAILSEYAKKYIGDFKLNDEGNGVILVGYDKTKDGSTVDDAAKLAFIKKHEIYHDKDATTGKYKTEDETSSLTDTIKARVATIKNLIYKNIVTKIYNEANSDSYKTNNYFYEYKFARAKFESSKITGFDDDLKDASTKVNIYDKKYEKELVLSGKNYTIPEGTVFTNKILIDSSISTENLDSIIGNDNSTGVQVLHLNLYVDYINRSVMPDILNNLLIEQYIYDNQYTTLSRTQARKINYIAITTTSNNINSARRLINTFVTNYIINGTPATQENYTPIDFDILADAWKGVYDKDGTLNISGSEAGEALLTDSKSRYTKVTTHDEAIGLASGNTTSYIDGVNHYYYQDTQYGALMENFAKINQNAHDSTSNEQWNSFTNSGSYSYEKGLEIKTNDILVSDYTKNIWGTTSSGFSDLPSSVTNNLFDYMVSIDTDVIPGNEASFSSDYVVLKNGRYFLRRSNSQSDDLLDSIVIKDGDSTTFYIVEIEAALSQKKMALSATTENGGYDPITKEEIAREVGYTLASGDTYKNTAYLYYLEKCNIKYHDQSIFDYMKETYPDLFDED